MPEATSPQAIEVKHLTRRFGSFVAVDDISFDVARGSIFGFLGSNGAGKSTTFRMLCGLLRPTSGTALVGGIDNPAGAVFGGFLVGVLENVLGAFVIGNELKLAVALVLIIGVLVVKPSGFFGKVLVTRV